MADAEKQEIPAIIERLISRVSDHAERIGGMSDRMLAELATFRADAMAKLDQTDAVLADMHEAMQRQKPLLAEAMKRPEFRVRITFADGSDGVIFRGSRADCERMADRIAGRDPEGAALK